MYSMSIQQEECQQNYGISIPLQLTDQSWKKCLLNDQTSPNVVFEGIVNIRKYLSQSIDVNYLISNVLQTEVHKPLFKYGKKIYDKILNGYASFEQINCLHEVIWIFTNLCCGQPINTNQILELGIVNFCRQLFLFENQHKIISVLFELIGNLVGDATFAVKVSFLADANFYIFMRDKYKNCLCVPNFHLNSAWAFGNLFKDFSIKDKNYNIEDFEDLIMGYFPIINDLIQIQGVEGRKCFVQIFFFISKNQAFHVNQSLKIVEPFLFDQNQEIRQLVVQIIGNYIYDCDEGVDYAIHNPAFLNVLFTLLKKSNKSKFRKEAAWIISNIFAGTVNQVEKFVAIPTLFDELNLVLSDENNQSVIKQITWSISNSFNSCSQRAFQSIFCSSIIESLSLKLRQCHEKSCFKVYSEAVLSYLRKFELNPNLDFQTFNKNLNQIQLTLHFTLNNFGFESEINENVGKAHQKISSLLCRGPITEQQMMNNHLRSFKI